MSLKFAAILALLIILTACGKSEEEKKKEEAERAIAQAKAQMVAIQIEQTQRKAVIEALHNIISLKELLGEYYSAKGECSDKILSYADIIKSSFVKNITVGKDCTLNVFFIESALTPDLSGQAISLKMTQKDGYFEWSCSFSGTNKKDIPSSCK